MKLLKDDMIEKLYTEKVSLQKELLKQVNLVNEAEKYQIDNFIEWICDKFNFGDSKELVKKFENDTHTLIDPVKQIKKGRKRERT